MKKDKPHASARLRHMLDAARLIHEFLEGYDYAQFTQDVKTQSAVVRQIEIIGEATYHLPNEFKTAYSPVPWSNIEGMRHKIVHDYYEIRLDIVWAVATKFVPELRQNIESILSTLSSSSKD